MQLGLLINSWCVCSQLDEEKRLDQGTNWDGSSSPSLITGCITYLGTHNKLLDWILEQEKALIQILAADSKTRHLKPLWQDSEVMALIVSTLKPISNSTDVLSGEECATAPCSRLLLKHLHNEALAEKEGNTTLKSNIQQSIKEYIKAKYDDKSVSRAH